MHGVYTHAVEDNLVVEVGCKRQTAVARESNDVATLNLLTLLYACIQEVAIRCLVAVTVLYGYRLTVRRVLLRERLYNAVSCGKYGCTLGYEVVYAVVLTHGAVEWVYQGLLARSKEC